MCRLQKPGPLALSAWGGGPVARSRCRGTKQGMEDGTSGLPPSAAVTRAVPEAVICVAANLRSTRHTALCNALAACQAGKHYASRCARLRCWTACRNLSSGKRKNQSGAVNNLCRILITCAELQKTVHADAAPVQSRGACRGMKTAATARPRDFRSSSHFR